MSDAIGFYSTARGYVHSLFLMMSNVERLNYDSDIPLFFSYHLLSGFAVELYLKALLLNYGESEKELKIKYGHDLKKLDGRLKVLGADSPHGSELVRLFAEHHKSNKYRCVDRTAQYVTSNGIVEIFQFFGEFDFFVDTIVGASASLGQTPCRSGWKVPVSLDKWKI